jgi:hypothetical protein
LIVKAEEINEKSQLWQPVSVSSFESSTSRSQLESVTYSAGKGRVEELQALRETMRNLRIAHVTSEYKPDFVSLELMSPG